MTPLKAAPFGEAPVLWLNVLFKGKDIGRKNQGTDPSGVRPLAPLIHFIHIDHLALRRGISGYFLDNRTR